MSENEWEIYLTQIDNNTWARIRTFIGNNMTPNFNRFITTLENQQLLQDFQARELIPHVRAYIDGGGEITGPPEAL